MDERVKVKIGRPRILHSELRSKKIQTVDPVPLVVQTRYGRYAGNWALSELH